MLHSIRLTAKKIAQRLALVETLVYRYRQSLSPMRYKPLVDDRETPSLDPGLDVTGWQVILPQSYWGGQNINFVLRNAFAIPAHFDRSQPIALFLPLGDANTFSHPEALVYIDGTPQCAVDRHHQEILLSEQYCDGNMHSLVLHGWTGMIDATIGEPGKQLFMRECAMVQIDTPTHDFIAIARTMLQAADLLDDQSPQKHRFYTVLDHAFKLLDICEPLGESFYISVPDALAFLQKALSEIGPALDVDIVAVGHAHIDVAWLWTLDQTRHKASRTFHNVLHLMEQFPEFHFTQSQPQLYDFIRQDYPDLFEAIKQRVSEGRWEVTGGMWVEADCNISGGEALARQFLLGRSFFKEHFGEGSDSPVLWLPDVFGFTWSLPQLIKQAGLDYFFTIKLGWNQYNEMPYDSFWWQGLDGTRVLAHFSPTPDTPWGDRDFNLNNMATYNADLSAFTALGTWTKIKHKASERVMLMSYGYGDGGGGPTHEMNENAQVLKSFPALPRVKQGTALDFFQQLEAESGDNLPTWNGELYLEAHRGTYTTQSRTKRANRKSEFLLHDAEFLCAWAALLDPAYQYPHQIFRLAWERVCLNQFHDIIPGSSIREVYVEAARQYAEVKELGESARASALEVIKAHSSGDVLIINPTGFERDDLAFWPGILPPNQCFAGDVFSQPVEGGTLIGGIQCAPYSALSLDFVSGTPAQPEPAHYPLLATPHCLENAYLRVEFDQAGDINRIYDKRAQREVLPNNTLANQFQAFEDRPLDWDAWDIDIFYDDKCFLADPAESIRVIEQGPLRATLEIIRIIGSSRFVQRISLAYNSLCLDFDTAIEWHERHMLLKVAFPVDVLSPTATYEIQWGSIQRPTHRNTPWDWARFETPAQKWADLSENGYGVALINDCKYGYDILENVLRLSLLRSPTYPDPEADQGQHHFAYRLFPHTNHWENSSVVQNAYTFNDPLIVVSQEQTFDVALAPLISTTASNIIIETIKQAEDGNGLIVRFYECSRKRGWIMLRVGFPIEAAYLTNLLEDDQAELTVSGQEIELYVTPFQIATIRLIPNSKY